MKPTTRFRQLLAQPGLIVAPGAYDGLSAKLIEQAGFAIGLEQVQALEERFLRL
jgi:2-methylisocitrate lyase-like PEP mutase family enzyme